MDLKQQLVLRRALVLATIVSGVLVCGNCSATLQVRDCSPFDGYGVPAVPMTSRNVSDDEHIRHCERLVAQTPANDAYHVDLGVAHCTKASRMLGRAAAGDQEVSARAEHDFHLAVKEFQTAMTINPSNADAYAYQGMVFSDLNQYSNALSSISRAIQLGPTNSIVWYCRGAILASVWQPQEACEAYATTIRLTPDNVPPYLSLTRLYTAMNRYNDALGVCSNALARFPGRPEVVEAMAGALVRVGRAGETVEMCRRWLKDDPDNARVRYRLGQGLARLHQYDAAIQEQKQVLAANPRLCDAFNEIGVCLWEKGDRDAAIQELKAGLRVHTNCPVLSRNLGAYLEEVGAYDAAIEVLEKTWDANPHSFDVCVPLAKAYQDKGRYSEAKKSCFRLMALMPWIADPYFELADLCLDLGDYEQSVHFGREGLVRNPVSAEGWHNVGIALQRQRKFVEAVDALAQAIKLDPNALRAHLAYADTLRVWGKFKEARDACTTAANNFPTNPMPLCVMGLAWEGQFQFSNAVSAYRQALVLDTNCLTAIDGLGRMMVANGRLADAAAIFRQVVLREPTNSAFRASLISVLMNGGDRRGAYQMLNEGISAMPNDTVLMRVQAESLAAEGNVTGAVAVLSRAVQICPKDSFARFDLAHFYETIGQPAIALSNWLFIATNDPWFSLVHQRLGLTYARSGHLQDALAEFRQYAECVPGDAQAHNEVGYTYYQLGMYDEALREYETGTALNPNLGIICYNMALTYYAKGRIRDAVDYCEKAAAAGYPGNPGFLRMLRKMEKPQSDSVISTNR